MTTDAEALHFLATGEVPGFPSPSVEDRVAFARACLASETFKTKAWPHFVAFVDASNVARHRPVPAANVNEPKARLADLDAVVAALRKLRYVPFVVSDQNLFQLLDDPYEYRRKYTQYPHAVAQRREADDILLNAMRRLPEAACVTNDRFAKPNELRDFSDIAVGARHRFFRHRWEDGKPRLVDDTGLPMPSATRRLALHFENASPK